MTPAERDELRRKAEMKIEAEQLGMQPCCGAHAEWLDPQTVIALLDEIKAARAQAFRDAAGMAKRMEFRVEGYLDDFPDGERTAYRAMAAALIAEAEKEGK